MSHDSCTRPMNIHVVALFLEYTSPKEQRERAGNALP
jgi:hypothetical protein